MVAQFSHQAKSKGIELQTSNTAPSTAFSDKDLIRLILQNLLANAVKYTPTGTVKLAVTTTAETIYAFRLPTPAPASQRTNRRTCSTPSSAVKRTDRTAWVWGYRSPSRRRI